MIFVHFRNSDETVVKKALKQKFIWRSTKVPLKNNQHFITTEHNTQLLLV